MERAKERAAGAHPGTHTPQTHANAFPWIQTARHKLRPALTSREYFISENKNVIGRLFGSAIVRRQQFAAARPGGGKGTTHGENQKVQRGWGGEIFGILFWKRTCNQLQLRLLQFYQ
jgi:hypothetical protein